MSRIKLHLVSPLLLSSLILISSPVLGAVHWVGDSPACTGTNVHGSLNAALLAAALTPENDEIRLTTFIDYSGDLVDLVDWHPGAAGSLILSGGYSNCFVAQNGRAVFGLSTNDLLVVKTTSQPSSVVTLRNIEILLAGDRALVATGGAAVTLENVFIHDNPAGISVTGGASLSVRADSRVEDNTVPSTATGGGISCTGSGSYVAVSGRLNRNIAKLGGNLYVGSGCIAELFGGATLAGVNTTATPSVFHGGGVYIDEGGVLASNGGSSRVTIRDHNADTGGGLFVNGSGVALLYNTLFFRNTARIDGAAIHARNGGLAAPQIIMDRVASCPFSFSCSEIELNRLVGGSEGEAIYATNSWLDISRTILDLNGNSSPGFENNLITAANGARIDIDGLGVSRNDVTRIFNLLDGAIVRAAHVTTALNTYDTGSGTGEPWAAVLDGTAGIDIRNSILNDMKGINSSAGSTVSASCNLVDTGNGSPPGSFFVGTAVFLDAPGGGIIQTPTSPGVDMCDEDGFDHTGSIDTTFLSRPVDELTNPNGAPGVPNGIYDAGMSEVHDNVFMGIFADGFESGNTSAWSLTQPEI